MKPTETTEKPILKTIYIRYYAELNDFLPPEKQYKTFPVSIKTPATIGETIHSLGIPLSEVDLILINSQPVARSHQLQHNDRVSVYPIFETLDISSLQTTQRSPLRSIRFILDAHLGKLAKYLRMLGFDTLYKNDFEDDRIIEIARNENRIILTRDKPLLKSPEIDHGYYVRAIGNHQQLTEVVNKFDLFSSFRPFTRCMTCNSILIAKTKDEIRPKVDADIYRIFDEFFLCPNCDKVFWKGSHFERMEKYIADLLRHRL